MKYAEVIKAALDGKTIEVSTGSGGSWMPVGDVRAAIRNMTMEFDSLDYRIQPKLDKVVYQNLYHAYVTYGTPNEARRQAAANSIGMVKLVLDGETGKVKEITMEER